MFKFRVTEHVVYEVVAESAEEAVNIIVNAADRDKYVVVVTDRWAQPA